MTAEATHMSEQEQAKTRRWSRGYRALLLLLMSILSPLAGGAAAFLTIRFLSASTFFARFDQQPEAAPLYLSAALACLLIGPLFGWLGMIRPRYLTAGRGALIGVLSSLAAHPLAWLIALVLAILTGRPYFLFFETPTSPGDGLLWLGYLSLYSLIYMGWFTALLGGLVGWFFGWLLMRLPRRK